MEPILLESKLLLSVFQPDYILSMQNQQANHLHVPIAGYCASLLEHWPPYKYLSFSR